MNRLSCITALFSLGLLSGCAAHNPTMWETAKPPKATPVTNKLNALPPSGQKAAVAVYSFTDQTGQFKPTDGAQTLSRAVTQGATSILVKSLHEAGNRDWFTVIERERLDNLLRERAVIREMRSSYLGEKQLNPQALPPLLFAGVLLEGGVIGFDSNTKTGGSGARLLGIGGRTQYREDTVTVYLRAVSVKTGEVLASVSSRKSIASVAVGADAFQFVAFKELLELEAGVTYNEPDELALRQAIEAVVYALIMEGTMQNLWCMAAPQDEVAALLIDYVAERDSISKSKVVLPAAAQGQPPVGVCGQKQVSQSQPQQQLGVRFQARQANTQGPITQTPVTSGLALQGPVTRAPVRAHSPSRSTGEAPVVPHGPMSLKSQNVEADYQPEDGPASNADDQREVAEPVSGLSKVDRVIPGFIDAITKPTISAPSVHQSSSLPIIGTAENSLQHSFSAMLDAVGVFASHAAREISSAFGSVNFGFGERVSFTSGRAVVRVALDRGEAANSIGNRSVESGDNKYADFFGDEKANRQFPVGSQVVRIELRPTNNERDEHSPDLDAEEKSVTRFASYRS